MVLPTTFPCSVFTLRGSAFEFAESPINNPAAAKAHIACVRKNIAKSSARYLIRTGRGAGEFQDVFVRRFSCLRPKAPVQADQQSSRDDERVEPSRPQQEPQPDEPACCSWNSVPYRKRQRPEARLNRRVPEASTCGRGQRSLPSRKLAPQRRPGELVPLVVSPAQFRDALGRAPDG